MTKKPSYERLRKRVRGPEREVAKHKLEEDVLGDTEERPRDIADYLYSVHLQHGRPYETIHGPGCAEVTGYTSQEFEDDPYLWIHMVHEEDRKAVEEYATHILSGVKVGPLVHRIIRKDGAMRRVRNTPSLHYDARGRLSSYDGLIEDISDHKLSVEQRTAELERVNEQLRLEIEKRKRAEEALKTSELRIRSLIEQTTDAVFCYEYDPPIPTDLPVEEQVELLYQGVLVECNDVCARSYGASRAENVIGGKLTELFGTTPRSLDKLFTALIRGGYRIVDGEGVEKLEDGTERYFLNNGHGVVENNKLVRVWGTFRDITERKRAEEALRESEARYRTLMEQIPAITYSATLDDASSTLYISPQIETMTGFTQTEYKNNPDIWSQQLYPEDRDRVLAELAYAHKSGEPFISEYRMMTRDGGLVWFRDEAVVVHDAAGEPLCLQGVMFNMTKRKETEEALQQSEYRYRLLVENIPSVTWITSEHGKTTFISPNVQRVYGYSQEEVYEGGDALWFERIHPDDVELVRQSFERMFNEGQKFDVEYRIQTKDGRWIWLHDTAIMAYEEDDVQYAYGVFSDITDRKRAQQQLRKSEALLRNTFEAIPDLMTVHDRNLRIVASNWHGHEYVTDEEHAGQPYCYEAYMHRDTPCEPCHALEVFETGKPKRLEKTNPVDAITREINVYPVFDETGNVAMVTEHIRDITDRKRAEEELKKSKEKLRALAVRLTELEELERKVLARELHDRVGQNLTALNINLNIVRNQLLPETGDGAIAPLDEAMSLVEETTKHIRDVMGELRPEVLDDYGLAAALSWYANRFLKRTGVAVVVEGEEPAPRLSRAAEIGLFRITQEAMTNVAKHAEPNQVTITLEEDNGVFCLSVADDGKGFDSSALSRSEKRPGWGLLIMQERAQGFGGQVRIESELGKGTRVAAEVRR